MPLAWSKQRVFLLARDGRLWDFAPNQTDKFRKTSSSFSSYSAAEIRAGLERELGGRLQVTGHRPLPGCPSAWQGSLGPAVRRFIPFLRALFSHPRRGNARARVSARGCGLGTARGFCALCRRAGHAGPPRSAGVLFAEQQSRDALRPGRRITQSRLATERRHDHPRSHAPGGFQHRHSQSIRQNAQVAGRRAWARCSKHPACGIGTNIRYSPSGSIAAGSRSFANGSLTAASPARLRNCSAPTGSSKPTRQRPMPKRGPGPCFSPSLSAKIRPVRSQGCFAAELRGLPPGPSGVRLHVGLWRRFADVGKAFLHVHGVAEVGVRRLPLSVACHGCYDTRAVYSACVSPTAAQPCLATKSC